MLLKHRTEPPRRRVKLAGLTMAGLAAVGAGLAYAAMQSSASAGIATYPQLVNEAKLQGFGAAPSPVEAWLAQCVTRHGYSASYNSLKDELYLDDPGADTMAPCFKELSAAALTRAPRGG